MDDDTAALAFNQGSDARLAGRPVTSNPYSSSRRSGTKVQHQCWRDGWMDVDRNWGRDRPPAVYRELLAALPPVQGIAS